MRGRGKTSASGREMSCLGAVPPRGAQRCGRQLSWEVFPDPLSGRRLEASPPFRPPQGQGRPAAAGGCRERRAVRAKWASFQHKCMVSGRARFIFVATSKPNAGKMRYESKKGRRVRRTISILGDEPSAPCGVRCERMNGCLFCAGVLNSFSYNTAAFQPRWTHSGFKGSLCWACAPLSSWSSVSLGRWARH